MVSTSGPIGSHPGYGKGGVEPRQEAAVPRVRPEAERFYKQAQGTVGMVLQIEGQRVPSGYSRPKPQPKDHMSANVRRMRQIQRQTRKKEADKEEHQPKPVKALWKSTKYEGVESRVKGELSKAPDAPRPHSASYLRAHSRTGWVPMSARAASTEPLASDESRVPTSQSAREVKFIRRELDFIQINGRSAKKAGPMRRSPSLNALDDMKDEQLHVKGEIPKYLSNRKKQWEREAHEALSNIPDPEMPEGHRLMPEEERRQTLDKLKQTAGELERKLASMPIRTDTMRLKTQKRELEAKMAEVEEAIKIFSRRKVFVRCDEY